MQNIDANCDVSRLILKEKRKEDSIIMLRHKKKNLATPTEILKQSLVQYYRQDICKFFTCKRKLVFATKFFLGSIVCIGLAMLSHTASVSAATIQTAVNNCTYDYTASDTTVQFNGKTTATGITCIRINNIDMLPVKSTITALSAAYRYDEATGALTITGNGGEHRIIANVNALSATVDGTNITLPYPIIRGENITDQSADFYIPMDFYLKQLGYSYTYNNQTLSVTSSHLFAVTSPDNSYNDTVYSNAISGIILDANASGTENSIQVTTVKEMNASDLKISSDTKEYSVTMAFSGVKNGIGAYEKNIQNGIVRSIHIWEDTSMHSTYVKIYYEKKYVYTKKTLSNGGKITLSKGNFSLKVALPDNVKFSKIKTTDQYWKKRFLIVIPGKQKNFYKENPPYKNSSGIKNISIKETSAGNTQIIVNTKSLKGYKLLSCENGFTVNIGSPKKIYRNIIMLDAGHGKKDSGATAAGVKEKNLCLDILYNKAKEYFDSTSSNVKAYLTRHDDTFINLYQRPKYSKRYSADLFLSLHMNFSTSKRAKGTEVYYSKVNNKKSFSGLNSKIFATRMRNTIVNDLHTTNRGIKQAGFVVIKRNTVPAVLVELGFVSNPRERGKLKTSTYQMKAAKSLYKGVSETFKKYPTARSRKNK